MHTHRLKNVLVSACAGDVEGTNVLESKDLEMVVNALDQVSVVYSCARL